MGGDNMVRWNQAVAADDGAKDLTAAASSSMMSKTVYSLVICITSWTLFVRLSSFNSPPCVCTDRKSTRLNSSHGYISYAGFCLKKTRHSRSGSRALRGCAQQLGSVSDRIASRSRRPEQGEFVFPVRPARRGPAADASGCAVHSF